MEQEFIVFYDEDDNEIRFSIIKALNIENEKYILVIDEEDYYTILHEYSENDNEEILFEEIEDEEKFEEILEYFSKECDDLVLE